MCIATILTYHISASIWPNMVPFERKITPKATDKNPLTPKPSDLGYPRMFQRQHFERNKYIKNQTKMFNLLSISKHREKFIFKILAL